MILDIGTINLFLTILNTSAMVQNQIGHSEGYIILWFTHMASYIFLWYSTLQNYKTSTITNS